MLDSVLLFIGAASSLVTGLASPITPSSESQTASVWLPTTYIAPTTTASTTAKIIVTAPEGESVARGGTVNVGWTATSVPAAGRVNITLSPAVGSTPAPRVLAASVLASAGSKSVVIPATTAQGSYKITLAPVGMKLTADSVLQSQTFPVTLVSASLSASVNKTEVLKGETITASWSGTNVPATAYVSVSVINAGTNATAVAAVNVLNSAKTRTITLPKTLADGTYKVLVSATVDGQLVTAQSSEFTVSSPVVLKPAIKVTSTEMSVQRGYGAAVTWKTSNVPATGRVHVSLAPLAGSKPASVYLALNVLASQGYADVKIPAGTALGDYKFVLTPIGFTPDPSSSNLSSEKVTVKQVAASLFASLDASPAIVARGKPITVTWTGDLIAPGTLIKVSVVKESDSSTVVPGTNVAFSAKKKVVTIPTTLVDGSYKFHLSAIVDGQVVTALSPVFYVAAETKPITLTSVTPNSGKGGEILKIKGKNFPLEPVIYLNLNGQRSGSISGKNVKYVSSTEIHVTLTETHVANSVSGLYKLSVANKATGLDELSNELDFTIKSTLTTPPIDQNASCPTTTFTKDLTVGSQGNDVVALQKMLAAKGHLSLPSGSTLGYYGSQTMAAVASYQVSVGISPADGYFGAVTRATLYKECTTAPTTGLQQKDVTLEFVSSETAVSSNGNGVFQIKFKVTALSDDLYLSNIVDNDVLGDEGVAYSISTNGSQAYEGTKTGLLMASTADYSNGFYEIEEGNTETFILVVSLDPSKGALYSVGFGSLTINNAENFAGALIYPDYLIEKFTTDTLYVKS